MDTNRFDDYLDIAPQLDSPAEDALVELETPSPVDVPSLELDIVHDIPVPIGALDASEAVIPPDKEEPFKPTFEAPFVSERAEIEKLQASKREYIVPEISGLSSTLSEIVNAGPESHPTDVPAPLTTAATPQIAIPDLVREGLRPEFVDIVRASVDHPSLVPLVPQSILRDGLPPQLVSPTNYETFDALETLPPPLVFDNIVSSSGEYIVGLPPIESPISNDFDLEEFLFTNTSRFELPEDFYAFRQNDAEDLDEFVRRGGDPQDFRKEIPYVDVAQAAFPAIKASSPEYIVPSLIATGPDLSEQIEALIREGKVDFAEGPVSGSAGFQIPELSPTLATRSGIDNILPALGQYFTPTLDIEESEAAGAPQILKETAQELAPLFPEAFVANNQLALPEFGKTSSELPQAPELLTNEAMAPDLPYPMVSPVGSYGLDTIPLDTPVHEQSPELESEMGPGDFRFSDPSHSSPYSVPPGISGPQLGQVAGAPPVGPTEYEDYVTNMRLVREEHDNYIAMANAFDNMVHSNMIHVRMLDHLIESDGLAI